MVGLQAEFLTRANCNGSAPCVVLLVLLWLSLAGCQPGQPRMAAERSASPQPGDYRASLTVDEQERTYAVHIPPAYDGQRALPLVIVLHGGGGNARNAARITGMNDKADKEGFIVVYPEGSGRFGSYLLTWNAGRCCGYARAQNVDDVAFIRALIDQLQQQLRIDSQRIYATGASNGAMMTYRLGCELSDKLAAIASVAGYLAYLRCQPADPLPVMIFHGTADQHVPYEGGMPLKRAEDHEGIVSSVQDSVSFWVAHNACSPEPLREESGNIVRETYTGCRNNTEVVLYTIKEGGHAWPGGNKGTAWGDEPTKEISATDLMWEFFSRHAKH